jgi:hypothetical protein
VSEELWNKLTLTFCTGNNPKQKSHLVDRMFALMEAHVKANKSKRLQEETERKVAAASLALEVAGRVLEISRIVEEKESGRKEGASSIKVRAKVLEVLRMQEREADEVYNDCSSNLSIAQYNHEHAASDYMDAEMQLERAVAAFDAD